MSPRHGMDVDAQAAPGNETNPRPGAMYMRAEARRASELPGVAVLPRPRRLAARRMQLAALVALWLLIAGATAWVGLRWERASHPAAPAVASTDAAPPAAPIAEPTTTTPVARAAAISASTIATRPAAVQTVAERPAAPPAPVTHTPAVAPAATRAVAQPARHPAPVRLVIRSAPAGAFVTVDGIGWGATPVRIGYLPPGVKHVRVTKAGYASQERTIEIGDGTATLSLALRPLDASSRP